MINRLVFLAAIGATAVLTACAAPPPPAPLGTVALQTLDSALSTPCDRPVLLPAVVTSTDVDPLWSRDRAALAACADRHAALVATVVATRKALAGR
jgi:hypothetical protein